MIYPIHHLPDKIQVGIQTEQGVEVIGFDLKPWLDAFPDMTFTVWHTRPGEKEAYPVNDHMMVGTVMYWHPDGYDTAIAGDGKVEIAGVGENRRKLSGFAPTAIQATSLVATKEPGESVAPWYEAVLQAAQDVKVNVDVGTGGLFLVNVKSGKSDRSQDEIRAAVNAGKTCLLVDAWGMVYTYFKETVAPWDATETNCPTFLRYERDDESIMQYEARVLSTGEGRIGFYNGVAKTPNPMSLRIAGKEYNGSKTVEVMPAPSDKSSAAYIRWNGTGYVPATVDSVKAELGGGGTSEVVILPETEFPGGTADTQIPITNPPSVTPTAGATAKVTYNGKDYACTIVHTNDSGTDAYMMGNFDAAGIPFSGGNPDAPFAVMIVPAGMGDVYGFIIPVEDADTITLSIVQEGGAASGGTVEVDATLTKAGTAADAKVTGDKIAKLSEEIEALNLTLSGSGLIGTAVDISKMQQGALPTLPGQSMVRTCSAVPHGKAGKVVFCIASGFKGAVQQYTTNVYSVRVKDSGVCLGDGNTVFEVEIDPDLYGVFLAWRADGSTITPNDGAVVSAVFIAEATAVKNIHDSVLREAAMSSEVVRSIAHRGSKLLAPENTLPAFIMAKENGFRWVECDVWWTSDGHPVLAHGDSLHAWGIEDVTITGSTLAVLQTYNLGASFGLSNVHILTFEDFLKCCKKLGLKAMIELKQDPTDEQASDLVSAVKKLGMLRSVAWLGYMGKIRTYDPKAKIRLLSTLTSGHIETASNYIIEGDEDGAALVVNYTDVTDETLVHEANEAGIVVGVYWDNNTDVSEKTLRDTIATLASYGVTEFTTNDYPAGWELYVHATE